MDEDRLRQLNKQDFLHVLPGSGIEKMEDNKTNAGILTTTGSRVDQVSRLQCGGPFLTGRGAVEPRRRMGDERIKAGLHEDFFNQSKKSDADADF